MSPGAIPSVPAFGRGDRVLWVYQSLESVKRTPLRHRNDIVRQVGSEVDNALHLSSVGVDEGFDDAVLQLKLENVGEDNGTGVDGIVLELRRHARADLAIEELFGGGDRILHGDLRDGRRDFGGCLHEAVTPRDNIAALERNVCHSVCNGYVVLYAMHEQ